MSIAAAAATRKAAFRNLEEEVRLDSVPVTGTVPAWLTGSLVRVTPAVLDDGTGKSLRHWFDGVAMLNAFGLGDGSVSYASRFLDTNYRRDVAEGDVHFGFATDPWKTDTDADGWSDGYETLTKGTNPLTWDTDGDGVRDSSDLDPLHNLLVAVRVNYIHHGASPWCTPELVGIIRARPARVPRYSCRPPSHHESGG